MPALLGTGRGGLRRTALLIAIIGCAGAALLAGCGSTSNTITGANGQVTHVSASSHPKTKFLLHAGLAYYAFHHYIWDTYRAGDFRHPFDHKVKVLEAGAAAAFTYHEVKLARQDVRSSALLSKLFSPLTAVADKLSSLKSAVTHGNFGAVPQIQNDLNSIQGKSAASGVVIHEVTKHIGL